MTAARAGCAQLRRGELHWLEWGPPGGVPVLALHGWMDNAASFSVLGPLLRQVRVVALDLPGHGLSYHRAPPGTYNIWDDLLDLLDLADHLGWERFALLAHSRGAMVASLLAGSMPERVTHLALLDGVCAGHITDEEVVTQLRSYLVDQRRSVGKSLKSYVSFDDALAARCAATGLSAVAARPLVERGLQQSPEGAWRWRSDPRLTLASAVKFTANQARAFRTAIRCPVMIFRASAGIVPPRRELDFSSGLEHLELVEVTGSHHCHLEQPAGDIARRLEDFLAG